MKQKGRKNLLWQLLLLLFFFVIFWTIPKKTKEPDLRGWAEPLVIHSDSL